MLCIKAHCLPECLILLYIYAITIKLISFVVCLVAEFTTHLFSSFSFSEPRGKFPLFDFVSVAK